MMSNVPAALWLLRETAESNCKVDEAPAADNYRMLFGGNLLASFCRIGEGS